jgi:hypothetical protein
MSPVVVSLWIYPVKSLAGIPVKEATITSRGFRHDRRLMLVDREGKFVTAREFPTLLLVETAIEDGDILRLTFPSIRPSAKREPARSSIRLRSLRLPLAPSDGATCTVTIWDDRVAARAGFSGEADAMFSEYLGFPVRLTYLADDEHRPVDARYATAGQEVSFADGFPFLATVVASLEALGAGIPMERFRPNLVLDGLAAFAEDDFAGFRVGDHVEFQSVKPCSRCPMVNSISLPEHSGEIAPYVGAAPLAQVAMVHPRVVGTKRSAVFGANLIATAGSLGGRVAVGAPCTII